MNEWDIDAAMREMQKLDSFFIPCFKCSELRAQIRSAANRHSLGVKVVETTEVMIKGLRVWRLT